MVKSQSQTTLAVIDSLPMILQVSNQNYKWSCYVCSFLLGQHCPSATWHVLQLHVVSIWDIWPAPQFRSTFSRRHVRQQLKEKDFIEMLRLFPGAHGQPHLDFCSLFFSQLTKTDSPLHHACFMLLKLAGRHPSVTGESESRAPTHSYLLRRL